MEAFQEAFREIAPEGYRLDPRLRGRRVVLYGAGSVAGLALAALRGRGVSVACLCDKERRGVFGPEALPVLGPEHLRASDVVVVNSMEHEAEITADLRGLGFEDNVVPYPRGLVFEQYLEGYAWAYDFFPDPASKQLVLDRIRLYLHGRPLAPNTASPCYYEEGLVALGPGEVYVDGGACDGDSALEFLRRAPDAWVYAFEPDPVSYEAACRTLAPYPRARLVRKGLWSAETELPFAENKANRAASRFCPGRVGPPLPVTTLDAFFQYKPETAWPTLIKLDVEGAEKAAVLGAADLIRKKKPRLALCAYHNPEDLYALPNLLQAIRGDYRFALRQHGAGAWDTVLYAV
jgi:FkbM family methyltransferase